jgi:hypothetical protein
MQLHASESISALARAPNPRLPLLQKYFTVWPGAGLYPHPTPDHQALIENGEQRSRKSRTCWQDLRHNVTPHDGKRSPTNVKGDGVSRACWLLLVVFGRPGGVLSPAPIVVFCFISGWIHKRWYKYNGSQCMQTPSFLSFVPPGRIRIEWTVLLLRQTNRIECLACCLL